MKQSELPLVGLICDREMIGPHPFHVAGEKYLNAIAEHSNCLPVLIPALATKSHIEQLIQTLDGILLTGGYSMVNPLHYQDEIAEEGTKLDNHRDNTSLLLIKKAIANNVPLLGICRGFQEMNVAQKGTLHQKLHQQDEFIEHRENKELPLAEQYGSSHEVSVNTNGKLYQIVGEQSLTVNSLHTQGINQLGQNLTIEATAPDGLIEAISVNGENNFALAVQWHPEWQVENNPISSKLFSAFGQACITRKQMRENNG
ncbi:gamma-glutamyl-gamma-aminobutyrate hydrolase family protein [Thalassotalea atypica]|uniref:gamma-glutamyl-gamma-aminobutyrate hydrolase family protein n=1 Tax=Thalassotalea atypica TaxID=2054316 RepID=UPI0025734AA5|nr:gamma-glutamyl-gamma-aminobutyrate hydrolase family protein [Thalassotalea atypica]